MRESQLRHGSPRPRIEPFIVSVSLVRIGIHLWNTSGLICQGLEGDEERTLFAACKFDPTAMLIRFVIVSSMILAFSKIRRLQAH